MVSTNVGPTCYTASEELIRYIQPTCNSSRHFDETISEPNNINCDLLFEGDEREKIKAKQIMKYKTVRIFSDEEIEQRASNCTSLKRESNYIIGATSKLEMDYPIAFSILIHENAQQFEYLLRHIYRPQNVYCVHIDAKSPSALHAAIKRITECFQNVFIASKLETIIYAGFARLQADINCMSDLLTRKEKWKYLLNQVGSVFPLRTNLEMVKILKIYNGANDIEGIRLNSYLKKRLEVSYLNVYPKKGTPHLVKTNTTKPAPPHEIRIVKGSAYGVFSRDFVQFALTDRKARDLLEWSRDTLTPDEHYWSTLHHIGENPQFHAPGGFKGDPVKKPWLAAYAAWPPRDKCSGAVVHGVCVFGVGDLPTLLIRREFFANKFSLGVEPASLFCMSRWITSRTRHPLPTDLSYYRQLPFISP